MDAALDSATLEELRAHASRLRKAGLRDLVAQ
jgi:hypothetical protein